MRFRASMVSLREEKAPWARTVAPLGENMRSAPEGGLAATPRA